MAFPQDAPSGQGDPIGSAVDGVTGDSSGGAGLLALLDADPENTDLIQQLVGESGSPESLTAELDGVVDQLTGTPGSTVSDLVDNIDDVINSLVDPGISSSALSGLTGELPSLLSGSSDGSGGLLDGVLSGVSSAASTGSLGSTLGGLSN